MSAAIHRLTEVGPPIGEPPQEIIDVLEELLAEAKRGELTGLGYFTVDGAGTVAHRWVSDSAGVNDMVAGASYLHFTVMSDEREGRDA